MWVRIKNSLWANAALALAALAVLGGGARMARDAASLARERNEAAAKAAALAEQKTEYLRRVAEYDTREAVEYQAKARLNLKKPGEVVVVVPEPIKKDQQASPSSGLLRMIRDFFAKIF